MMSHTESKTDPINASQNNFQKQEKVQTNLKYQLLTPSTNITNVNLARDELVQVLPGHIVGFTVQNKYKIGNPLNKSQTVFECVDISQPGKHFVLKVCSNQSDFENEV